MKIPTHVHGNMSERRAIEDGQSRIHHNNETDVREHSFSHLGDFLRHGDTNSINAAPRHPGNLGSSCDGDEDPFGHGFSID